MDDNQLKDIIYHSSTDTLFYNSQCLFIEFHDVIETPWFILLYLLKNNKKLMEVFKINDISSYSLEDILEWYIYRKHRNIFKSLGLQNDVYDNIGDVSDEWYDKFLNNCISNLKEIYMVDTKLIFYKSLNILLNDSPGMVKKIIIYSEYNEPGIKYFLDDMVKSSQYSSKLEYVYGDFETIIKNIPNDSTYVISDIEKINKIKKANKLYMSSILIVNGLRYNYEIHNKNKLKVDIPEISKDTVFKCSFFDNFSSFNGDKRYNEIMNKNQQS